MPGEAEMPSDGEAPGSGSGVSWHLSSNGMGAQNFSDIHNSGSSRNHFGNIYNMVYPSVSPSTFATEKPNDLMKALEFKGMGQRLMTVSPACVDTCTWFLQTEEYTKWRDAAHRLSHNGVLWIKGKAGTGKSTIMRCIHDHALNHIKDEVTIAFFFNGRSPEALEKSTEGMYRSVMHQIYSQKPRLEMAANQKFHGLDQHTWSVEILQDLFRTAVLNLASDERVTCYIDALDECDIDQVRSAIEFFEALSESATHAEIRFLLCFSSRHYPQITMQAHEEVVIDALPEHLEDISIYINHRLILSAVYKLELQSEISKRCSGIFLWVVLVVKLLKDAFDKGATWLQLCEILRSLPHELDALFTKISESADAGFAVAMRWVLFAERSLSITELYCAVRVSLGQLTSRKDMNAVDWDAMVNYIRHVSRGLVEFSGANVQFIHDTVREYLRSSRLADLCSVPQHSLEATSHAAIAADCQKYLAFVFRPQARLASTPEMVGMNHNRSNSFSLGYYVLECLFAHFDRAYIGGALDLTLFSNFPLHDFIALDDSSRYRNYVRPLSSSAFISILIAHRCDALAGAMVEFATCSGPGLRATDTSNQVLSSSVPFLKPNLRSLCGGAWGSPLHAAVRSGRKDLVHLLLNYGADVNLSGVAVTPERRRSYEPPLMLAVQYESIGMVQLLLASGAHLNYTSPSLGFNALHRASVNLDLEKVELLLSWGADTELPCETATGIFRQGLTALHLAASSTIQKDHSSVLLALLDGGANVNAIDAEGRTALHLAVSVLSTDQYFGYYSSVLPILFEAGANVGATDAEGRTALHTACSVSGYGIPTTMVREFLHAGADVNATDAKGRTALIEASSKGLPDTVRLLLVAGANANAIDGTGDTALHAAVSTRYTTVYEQYDMVRDILNAGADVGAIDGYGNTALMLARKQHLPGPLVELLVLAQQA
jgi:ankyrin repeat protein